MHIFENMVKKRVQKEEFFYSVDGKIIKNLADLQLALMFMDDMHFFFHVTEEKHDFAQWVNDVLGEYKLAKQMSVYRNKEMVLGELTDFLKKG